MYVLFKADWQAFDPWSGIKVSLGLIVMLLLIRLTGEPWLATSLVVLFAWLSDVPGALRNRVAGVLAFASGAILLTLISGQIELSVWPNVIGVALVGFLGTWVLVWGMRPFMVGWALICWAIYGPFLVETTSVANCLLAIVAGCGVLILLNAIGHALNRDSAETVSVNALVAGETSTEEPDVEYITVYAVVVALVLAVTTYYGWIELKTDPTLMAGGAFFVIGFDTHKTWVAGVSRIVGLVAGTSVGLLFAQLLGPGPALEMVMIAACGLSFAAVAVNPGAWMFFFMIFVASGWQELQLEVFDLTFRERFYGEIMGVIAAMVAIVFLHWWHKQRLG